MPSNGIYGLPTIPSSWTAPTSCFAKTRYYRVSYAPSYVSNLYGTPTPVLTGNAPSGECFPPSFTINVPYRTDGGCPTGYTRACATGGPDLSGRPMSTVTCCPSVTSNAFSFMCQNHEYGCHATATVGAVWTGVITNFAISKPTEEPVTRTPWTGEGLEAWGIKFIWVAATSVLSPSASTATEITTTTSEASSTASEDAASPTVSTESSASSSPPVGLSPGVAAGIAVGAAAAVGLLALVGFLVYRNKRKKMWVEGRYVEADGTEKAPPVHEAPGQPASELQG
ncbi:hypothetical protein CPLU01_12290 [Colletotrichum plurivorum]|uniref:Uncharacterized protein n=1 Tax=Colletotrichum plurivorum TaxID=2175906 RepID=A0A8H6N698_9PEZI|nr:hypothetical protein CPLU01_12290 [Colletotrichum plurivorum]